MVDLAIAGAGPAGLATALFAAQRGLGVRVLDRRQPPLDKACGEGIMPGGVALLQRMGVRLGREDVAAFSGVRYIDGAIEAEGRFSSGLGWGVRRTTLMARMLQRAQELDVEVCYGTAVSGWRVEKAGRVCVQTSKGAFSARLFVGADGLNSRIRRQALLGRSQGRARRFGLRRHFRVAPWSSLVEVYWSDEAEAYVTPVGREEVGVAFLWRGRGRPFEKWLERFPELRDRLRGAVPTSRPRGAGPFPQKAKRRVGPGVALVGDAAGYLDALSGEGLSLGFAAAQALVETVTGNEPLTGYESAYRRLSRSYYWMTSLLMGVAGRPVIRRRVVAALAQDPDLFDGLLSILAGEAPLRTLAGRTGLRLMRALVPT